MSTSSTPARDSSPGTAGPGLSRPGAPPSHVESIRDTLISIVIAFTLAFVFRGFVVEAFVIPTGSMAPTLMGAHMLFRSPSTGYTWPVGPWESGPGGPQDYTPVQHGPVRRGVRDAIMVHDPVSGDKITRASEPLRAGDRILVLKYLYSVQEPSRFDVVVFKNPTDPSINYIKRLIGLPGEEVALVDGDVFTRSASHAPENASQNLWERPGWRIARKPALQQRAVWQMVFDSAYAPVDGSPQPGPWASDERGAWDFSGPGFRYTPRAGGPGQTELFFDATRRRFAAPLYEVGGGVPPGGELWSINDRYPYDETPGLYHSGAGSFPVSDVRLRAGIEPAAEGVEVAAVVRARGLEFRAELTGAVATLKRRTLTGAAGVAGAWETLATGAISPLRPGRVTDVEFWHADQALRLYVDGALVAEHEYEWTPAERILAATGRSLEEVLADNPQMSVNPLANPGLYRKPDVRWAIRGGGVVMLRVGLDRDLHYQPAIQQGGRPALATSPDEPLVLGAEQIFCCGDNSPQSLDGRLWGEPSPWVAYEFDKSPGVVPRDLLLGKAFFVYWPAPHWNGLPVPDFGRMRFIR